MATIGTLMQNNYFNAWRYWTKVVCKLQAAVWQFYIAKKYTHFSRNDPFDLLQFDLRSKNTWWINGCTRNSFFFFNIIASTVNKFACSNDRILLINWIYLQCMFLYVNLKCNFLDAIIILGDDRRIVSQIFSAKS